MPSCCFPNKKYFDIKKTYLGKVFEIMNGNILLLSDTSGWYLMLNCVLKWILRSLFILEILNLWYALTYTVKHGYITNSTGPSIFVRYCHEFVKTVIVLTEFDCGSTDNLRFFKNFKISSVRSNFAKTSRYVKA